MTSPTTAAPPPEIAQSTGAPASENRGLRRRIGEIEWYHTLDLAPGVATPGWFDTRPVPYSVGFPATLEGKRCLDVATFDGFWAFTMEKRGAAEVIAIDVPDPAAWDWPAACPPEAVETVSRRRPGAGFALAAEVLESQVKREELSVYDLDPNRVGTFDFVYVGSLLLHLRDPVGALMKIRGVCTGDLLVVDAVHGPLADRLGPAASLDGRGRPWWFKPTLPGLARMVEAAGFEVTRRPRRVRFPAGAAQGNPSITFRTLTSRSARETIRIARSGDPHGVVPARATDRPADVSF